MPEHFFDGTVSSVDWAKTPTQFASPIDGTATVTSGAAVSTAYGQYDVRLASFSTGSIGLAAGTYYLVLQNAVTANDSSAYSDLNNRRSTTSQNGDAIAGSQAFQILGTIGAVPEPGSWSLLIAGFAVIGVAARRRTVRAAA